MRQRARVRMRATVHYDGTGFHGWQSQPAGRTVQGVLEECLAGLFGSGTERVRVVGAGRTDAGVHAAGQEIAFGAPARWSPEELRRALNATLPGDVWVEAVASAAPRFHPRFDATGRRYEYLAADAPDAGSPLRAGRVWVLRRRPDEDALRAAASRVPGERSFAAFARSGQPERGTRCRVEEAWWQRTPVGDLRLVIVADRFLHRMVRYLVGTMVEVACGDREEGELSGLLAGKEGIRPPRPAPPHGLYLTGVRYPEGWNRPAGIPGLVPPAERPPEGGVFTRRAAHG